MQFINVRFKQNIGVLVFIDSPFRAPHNEKCGGCIKGPRLAALGPQSTPKLHHISHHCVALISDLALKVYKEND